MYRVARDRYICTQCGVEFVGAMANTDRPPKIGDYSICGHCLTVFVYVSLNPALQTALTMHEREQFLSTREGRSAMDQVTRMSDQLFAELDVLHGLKGYA